MSLHPSPLSLLFSYTSPSFSPILHPSYVCECPFSFLLHLLSSLLPVFSSLPAFFTQSPIFLSPLLPVVLFLAHSLPSFIFFVFFYAGLSFLSFQPSPLTSFFNLLISSLLNSLLPSLPPSLPSFSRCFTHFLILISYTQWSLFPLLLFLPMLPSLPTFPHSPPIRFSPHSPRYRAAAK